MKPKRRWLVPEVVQTSAMDCGPAALKALLDGYGVPVSYGRLREACQTDVDGTSIEVLEETARLLGLDAEQVMLPLDHLLLAAPDSLPAIVVTQPNGGDTHFVLLWRRCGPFVQVMDPGVGRRWLRAERFLAEVYRHSQAVPAEDWREWAGTDDFLSGLRARIAAVAGTEEAPLIESALADPSWFSLAALDAAARMAETLARNGGIRRGGEGRAMLRSLYRTASETPDSDAIPPSFWQVTALDDGEQLMLNGAVLIRINDLLESGPEAGVRAGSRIAAGSGGGSGGRTGQCLACFRQFHARHWPAHAAGPDRRLARGRRGADDRSTAVSRPGGSGP